MKAIKRLDPAGMADEARGGFVRHLAHELRNYLANVSHSAELLTDGVLGPLAAPQQEVAQILRQNGLRLQWLTEYLLAWQAWPGAAARSKLALRALIERCVQRCQPLARSRKVTLATRAGAGEVSLDSAAVGLLLDNLLSHALKCAPAGGTVSVDASVESGAVLIEVRDDGPAVPAAQRAALLEAFDAEPLGARDGQPASRGGLGVARACALAHGGQVEFIPLTRGSGVRARLPAGAAGGH